MKKKLIEIWINKKGYELVEGLTDQHIPDLMRITYSKRLKPENQIYSILHECGHLIIQNSACYDQRYKIQTEALEDGRKKRSLRWRINFLKEEFEAWDKGKQLAEKLGIEIDLDEYDRYAARWLKTYCQFVVDKDYGGW